jgi:hypothetical protein
VVLSVLKEDGAKHIRRCVSAGVTGWCGNLRQGVCSA